MAAGEVKLISLTPQEEAAKIKRRLIIDFLKKYVHEKHLHSFCYETIHKLDKSVLEVNAVSAFFPQIQHTDISVRCESADCCILL